VQFNGSASDPNDVLSFAWDFGDGKSAFGPTAYQEVAALFWTKNRAALSGELLQRNGDNANAKE
jgi:hypothetical protein